MQDYHLSAGMSVTSHDFVETEILGWFNKSKKLKIWD